MLSACRGAWLDGTGPSGDKVLLSLPSSSQSHVLCVHSLVHINHSDHQFELKLIASVLHSTLEPKIRATITSLSCCPPRSSHWCPWGPIPISFIFSSRLLTRHKHNRPGAKQNSRGFDVEHRKIVGGIYGAQTEACWHAFKFLWPQIKSQSIQMSSSKAAAVFAAICTDYRMM